MTNIQIEEVTKPKFKVGDRTFDNRADAEGHGVYLANKDLFESFLKHINAEKAQAGLLRRLLPQFVQFQSTYQVPTGELVDDTTGA